jgi:hydrogenase maturation protease
LSKHLIESPYGASLPERPESSANIVIIGMGNEFQGDDGVGPFVVQKLRTRDLPQDIVDFHCTRGFALIELWKDKEMAILVDAANSGAAPGSVFRFEPYMEFALNRSFGGTTHSYGLPEAIELAKILNQFPPHVIVYAIEAKRFDEGMGLSPEVERAAEEVVQKIVKEVWSEVVMRL